jgi:hypothetical protein
MLSSLAIVLFAAAPAPEALPAELPDFTSDLPSMKDVAKPPAKGGLVGGQFEQVLKPKGCEAGVSVDLGKAMNVTLNYVEKVQAWLDASPGLEAKVFAEKGTLGEVARLVGGSKPAAEKRCGLSAEEGWKLVSSKAPAAGCDKPSPRLGDYWWLHADKPAGVFAVSAAGKASTSPCAVRVSAVLFDQKGKTRLQVHNDLQSPPSFTLLGDWCRNVEFKFDENLNGFKARPTKCKP